jgi:hypothetical protein
MSAGSTLRIVLLATVILAGAAMAFGFAAVGCTIKGNIGVTGKRIYHVPGQEYYAATRIDWFRGERWFCSEQAAREAGWRKSIL